jgi:hypothetical protein
MLIVTTGAIEMEQLFQEAAPFCAMRRIIASSHDS